MFYTEAINDESMSAKVHSEVVLPTAKEMKGYFDFYMFQCEHESNVNSANFQGCNREINPNMSPMMAAVVPPEIEKNPYTGEQMQSQIVSFPNNRPIDKKVFKKWIGDFIPDYSLKLKSKAELDKVLAAEGDINKVVLLTTKAQPANVFKAVMADFRNKLRFYLVTVEAEDSPEAQSFKESLGVDTLPAIVLVQTYDKAEDKVVGESLIPFTEQTNYPNLNSFLGQYARDAIKEELAETAEEK